MNSEYFRMCNGEIIKHYSELPSAIDRMSADDFNSHVNQAKNDFARWVYDTYGLADLAGMLGEVKSKHETKRVLNAYLAMAEYKFKFKQPSGGAKEPEESRHEKKDEEDVSKKSDKGAKNSNLLAGMLKALKPEKMQGKDTVALSNRSEADRYFKENPLIVSQQISAKKESLAFEKLQTLDFSGAQKPEQLIGIFKDSYAKAYSQLVFLRKNGFDTKLAEVMLFRIPPKIKIFEASLESKDSTIIKRYLNEAIEEINNVR